MKGGTSVLLALRFLGGAVRRDPEGGGRGPRSTRYLRGALLGVALGLVPLVVVLLVADGMIEGITARYLETWSWHLQARPLGGASLAELREATAVSAGTDAGSSVSGAWSELRGAAVAVKGEKSAPILVRGVEESLFTDPGLRSYLRLEDGGTELGTRGVLVGTQVARDLGLAPGDALGLVAPDGAGGFRTRVFRVVGVVSAGYRDLDRLWVFLPLDAADRLLAPQGRQALVGIKIHDPWNHALAARREVEERLAGVPDAAWSVLTWKESETSLFSSFSVTRGLLVVVMGLTVLVAAANLGSALRMLAFERARDLAILRSAGATSGLLLRVFLLVGAGSGAMGALGGIGVGILISLGINRLIALLEALLAFLRGLFFGAAAALPVRLLDPAYYLETIPVRVEWPALLLVAGGTVALSVLFSILPARAAASLPPLEVFRKGPG